MGRIAPVGEGGITLFCIMVNTDIAQRAAGKGNYRFLCSEPSHIDIRQEPYCSPDPTDPSEWTNAKMAERERGQVSHEHDAGHADDDPWATDDVA